MSKKTNKSKKSVAKKTAGTDKPERKTRMKTREEIAPNVFKASDRSYYINVNGEMKYCIKERLDKLLERAEGNWERLVNEYRTRNPKAVQSEPVSEPTTEPAAAE